MCRRWVIVLVTMAAAATAKPPSEMPHEVTVDLNSFSDYLAASALYVLNARIDGENTHARLIKIGGLGRQICGGVLVRGEETDIPTSKIAPVLLKADLCNLKGNSRSIFGPVKPRGHLEAAKPGILAACGATPLALPIPWDYEIPTPRGRAATLFNLFSDLVGAAFGQGPVFVREDSIEQQRRALPWIDELRSGKFDAGFAPIRLGQILAGYRGVLGRDDIPTVAGRDREFRFQKFSEPVYPPLAQAARVRDSVVLRVPFDTETGVAGEPEVISGAPLLRPSAIRAAKEWQFDPSGLRSPVIIEIRYGLDCE